MSLHRSLKTKPTALNQHRNVLTRAERIERLREKGKFNPEQQSPIGLVKVANRMVATKKKKTEKAEGEGEAAAGTAAAPAAAAPAKKAAAAPAKKAEGKK
jgi:small basic protein (TIGR04137 family)